ncbi:MAG: heme exporter protein CcmD [Gammaproteobacteria bacterium]|nr:heme exporter protein CcmD [Gammaproteobacteria bacterium]
MTEMFQFGEHGVYVWSAWGLSVLIVLAMAAMPSLRWRAFKRRADLLADSEAEEH